MMPRPARPTALAVLIAVAAAACSPNEDSAPRRVERSPLGLTPHQKLTSSTAFAGGRFGWSLALDGNTLVVGAQEEGVAYVFVRSGSTFVEQQRIDPWDGETPSPIYAVALSGDTLFLGYAEYNSWGGVVFSYVRSGTTWTFEQRFDGSFENGFGQFIALDGDSVLLQASAVETFPFYSYERRDGVWQDLQIVPMPATVFVGVTGLVMRGDTAIVGSRLEPVTGGAAYVFERIAGSWTMTQRLTASTTPDAGEFGSSVAFDGTTVAIGAHQAPAEPPMGSGAVHLFERSGSSFVEVDRLVAPGEDQSYQLGECVAIDGNYVVASSYYGTFPTIGSQMGNAWLFERAGGTRAEMVTGWDAQARDEFGYSCAISGQIAAFGAPGGDLDITSDVGAVYAFAIVGEGCDSAADCLTGHCVDGVCCDSACDGSCDVCTAELGATADGHCGYAPAGAAGDPVCAPLACTGESADCEACASDDECPSGRYCSAEGRCDSRKDQGASCDLAEGADCAEDGCRACANALTCVDGVCCDEACSGSCDACSLALGATEDGVCTVLDMGPGEPLCRGGFGCDGSGPECPDSCDTDASCRASHYCTEQGTCAPRTCNEDRECGGAAPNCVDGICCDQPCDGQCEACDVVGREGVCSAVDGVPRGGREECAGAGEECGGECDGLDRERCHFQAGATACGDVSCDETTALGSACDGEGACVEQAPVSCEPYACGSSGCLTSCGNDSDCSTGNSCVDGSCVFTGGRCSEDRTNALDGDGNLVEECAPYFCVNGRCEDACVSTTDCQDGFLCDTAQGRCVNEAENEATNEGCGCRVKTNPRGSGFGAAWFLLALALSARRRLRSARP